VRVFDRSLHSRMPLVPTPAPLEASRRVTNGIPLGCPLFLPVHTVNCIQTRRAAAARSQVLPWWSCHNVDKCGNSEQRRTNTHQSCS
jgi:hypothetical protein